MKSDRIVVMIFVALVAVLLAAVGAQSAQAQNCGPNVRHTVRQGENLFRISLNHGTHYTVVAAANGISDPTRIYPGQVLVMPCVGGSSGQPATGSSTGATTTVILPATPAPGTTSVNVPVIPPVVDCTRFRATQPLDGFTFATQVFYWDAALGATSYRVLVYSADVRPGTLVAAQDVSGLATTARIPFGVDSIGQGFRFSYRIQALVADTPVCSTPLLTLFRQVPPN
jgi:hypothetical protein